MLTNYTNVSLRVQLNVSGSTRKNATSADSDQASNIALEVSYAIIFVLGVLGNFKMLRILGSRLRSSGNLLLLNMVVTESAVLFTNIPFDIVLLEVNQRWVFGSVMCNIMWPLQTLCFGAFVWTLALLSYHRYRGVVCMLNKKLSSRTMKCLIALVWIFSLVIVLPFGAFLEMQDDFCTETWSTEARKSFTVVLFTTQYAVPLLINSFCYLQIAVTVRRGETRLRKHITGSAKAESKRARRNLRAIRTAVMFVIIFAICMLPHQVLWMWMEFAVNTEEVPHLLTFAYIFTFTSSLVNPLVYIFSTPSVRKELCRKTYATRRRFSRAKECDTEKGALPKQCCDGSN